ncbi:MAG: transposase zinc-binding domain-containing protein [Deltaproteobacteria bacterium]|nr:transposase zinc-binding domain-containing protein [Deltaproteobacteria bacterium]
MLAARKLEEVVYRRREPEAGLLFRAVADNLETFLDGTRGADHELPAHVEKELREFLACGVLGNGFVRLRCDDCGAERAVAFSCKGRGFCPSCTGRRMSETAARLVDDVFPRGAPVRQWVLSLPIEVRYRLAHDGDLLSDVLAVFLRAVRGWYREAAKMQGRDATRSGSVTFAQRFGSALKLNPHFHSLMLDGVFAAGDDGGPTFHPAPALTDDDVRKLVKTVASRVLRLLERHGAHRYRLRKALPRRSRPAVGVAGHRPGPRPTPHHRLSSTSAAEPRDPRPPRRSAAPLPARSARPSAPSSKFSSPKPIGGRGRGQDSSLDS